MGTAKHDPTTGLDALSRSRQPRPAPRSRISPTRLTASATPRKSYDPASPSEQRATPTTRAIGLLKSAINQVVQAGLIPLSAGPMIPSGTGSQRAARPGPQVLRTTPVTS